MASMVQHKCIIPNEFSKEARDVRRIWERFIAGEDEQLELLRPVVRDSWLRCREYGVNPGVKSAPIVLSQEEARSVKNDNILCEAAAPVLHFLCEALEGRTFLVLLADPQCRLLDIFGDFKALEQATRLNVVVGSQWSEAQVGTDALAVSSMLRTPVQIHWSEHYCEQIGDGWAGSAAPIHAPFTGDILGTISIYGYGGLAHPQALALATDAATMVERRLYEKHLALRSFLFERYHLEQSRFPSDNLLCMDPNGMVLATSSGAPRLLGVLPEQLIGVRSSHLPELHELGPILEQAASLESHELKLQSDRLLKAVLFPVKKDHSLAGYILNFSAKRKSTEKIQAQSSWQSSYTFADIVGASPSLQNSKNEARQISQRDPPVLIMGESGTGKELFAHAIHAGSARRDGPFVPVNCGGMTEELLTSELFGYREGAFTGASRGGRIGKFELAHNGTIFLDEVEDMSPKMQAHLLRFLEEGRVVRIGAERPNPIDVRVIAAANVNLEAHIQAGRFRTDLYYRLNVLTLSLTPLRERREDIPTLVNHFLREQKWSGDISPGAMEKLIAYAWPGNGRQLRNILLQATQRSIGGTIVEADLPAFIRDQSVEQSVVSRHHPAGAALQQKPAHEAQLEKEALLQALKECDGNISCAAARLGWHRTTIYRKLEKFAIRTQKVWH